MSDKQWEFLKDVAKLIMFAEENGFRLTAGELYRTQSQQNLYYYGKKVVVGVNGLEFIGFDKRTKVKRSSHQDRLAIDLNVFVNNRLSYNPDELRPLGEYWKSLNQKNVWGGDWGWDAGHFERKQ